MKILPILLMLLPVCLFGQTLDIPSGSLLIGGINSPNAPTQGGDYRLLCLFGDLTGEHQSDSVAVGDFLYIVRGDVCAPYEISYIHNNAGGMVDVEVIDVTGYGQPTGGEANYTRHTPNRGYPLIVVEGVAQNGISTTLQQRVMDHLIMLLDQDINDVVANAKDTDTLFFKYNVDSVVMRVRNDTVTMPQRGALYTVNNGLSILPVDTNFQLGGLLIRNTEVGGWNPDSSRSYEMRFAYERTNNNQDTLNFWEANDYFKTQTTNIGVQTQDSVVSWDYLSAGGDTLQLYQLNKIRGAYRAEKQVLLENRYVLIDHLGEDLINGKRFYKGIELDITDARIFGENVNAPGEPRAAISIGAGEAQGVAAPPDYPAIYVEDWQVDSGTVAPEIGAMLQNQSPSGRAQWSFYGFPTDTAPGANYILVTDTTGNLQWDSLVASQSGQDGVCRYNLYAPGHGYAVGVPLGAIPVNVGAGLSAPTFENRHDAFVVEAPSADTVTLQVCGVVDDVGGYTPGEYYYLQENGSFDIEPDPFVHASLFKVTPGGKLLLLVEDYIGTDTIGADTSDLQTLSFSSPILSISEGNSVDLSSLQTTITGNEAAFSGWDKDVSDDFSGAWADLSGVPADLLDGDDIGTDDQTAAEVLFTPTLGISATDVQAAINETYTEKSDTGHRHVEADIIDLDHFTGADITGSESAFSGWDKNASDDFSGAWLDLAGVPADLLDGDDYEANTDTQKLSFVLPNLSITGGNSVDLSALQDGTGTDDQTAAEVSFSPAGNIAATDAQSAIEELDTEKAATGHTHTEADITDLNHFTGADITGSESAFAGWDKDGSGTNITAGTDITVTGTGTSGNPYVITSTASGGGGGGGITYDTSNAVFTGDFWINGDSIFQFTITGYTASLPNSTDFIVMLPVPGLTVNGVVVDLDATFQYDDGVKKVLNSGFSLQNMDTPVIWALLDQVAIIGLTNITGSTINDVRLILTVKYTK